jgi:hypothetical protein
VIGRLVGGIAVVYVVLLVARVLQRRVTVTQDRDLGVVPRKDRHVGLRAKKADG